MNTIIIILSFLPLALVGMVIYFNQRINKVVKYIDENLRSPIENFVKNGTEQIKKLSDTVEQSKQARAQESKIFATNENVLKLLEVEIKSRMGLKSEIERHDGIWKRLDAKIEVLFKKFYPQNNDPQNNDPQQNYDPLTQCDPLPQCDPFPGNHRLHTPPPQKPSRKPLPKKQTPAGKKVSSRVAGRRGKP